MRLSNRRGQSRSARRLAVILICLQIPLAMGGCPEFQDEVVNALETAVRGVADAAVSLYFDQFRSNN